MKKYLVLICMLALVSLSCDRKADYDKDIRQELSDLDRILAERPAKDAQKLLRIKSLTESLQDRKVSVSTRLNEYASLVDEYNAYQLDSLVSYLERQYRYADSVGAQDVADGAMIGLADRFASSGFYLESYDILSGLDTMAFTEDLSRSYYATLSTLSRELEENAGALGEYRLLGSTSGYLEKALSFSEPGSQNWQMLRLRLYMAEGNYTKAQLAVNEMLQGLEIGSRRYGNVSYLKALICEQLGQEEEKLLWEIRSAKSDMIYLNRDYTSLMLVARDLASYEPDRAFRYIQRCLEDAHYYNGKLRSWQITRILPSVQRSLEQRRRKEQEYRMLLDIILILLSFLLGFALFVSMKLFRSLAQSKSALAEANALRERYITDFLSRQSQWIDRFRKYQSGIIRNLRFGNVDEVIKELSISRVDEMEMDHFLDLFDRTFLGMFPTFVEDFNSLLKDEDRIPVQEEDGKVTLPTEIRIYALTRLGIENPGEIARLLNYSVRTIYNYKVKVRNSAIGSKEDFDEAVKNIGKQ